MLAVAHPWGKLARNDHDQVVAWQSLADHSRAVAGVFRALAMLPGIRLRLEAAAGESLDSIQLDRLAYLVFLHDCGKVNSGFQARVDPRRPPIGHIAPLAAIFGKSPDVFVAQRACAVLNDARIGAWGQSVPDLLDVIFSHHGAPWPHEELGVRVRHHWQATPEYDCWKAFASLVQAADTYLPHVDGGVHPLPGTPRFLHAIAGLVQLADWIGSAAWSPTSPSMPSPGWETRALERIGLDPAPWRLGLHDTSFAKVFGYEPYSHQLAAGSAPGRLLILESETGSGKTEAALWRFLQLFRDELVDGLYFALPTRTAAAQLHRRVERFAHATWGGTAPPVVLAVPGYLTRDDLGTLPDAADELDVVESDARRFTGWANSHPKRYGASLLGVGTIDQALLSTLLVKHAHLRGSLLMRHLLVVDEVHASDRYMQTLLAQLLEDHLAIGGHAMLLSATLGAVARERLLTAARGERFEYAMQPTLATALSVSYPVLTGEGVQPICPTQGLQRERAIEMRTSMLIDDTEAIAVLALDAARSGGKVLVIRNSVRGAIDVFRAAARLEQPGEQLLFRVMGTPAVHHGRFAREDRLLLDTAVEQGIGRTRGVGGCVVVGTQTLEQSLDIDADVLITDLCPADVLLQRLGRLHRHATEADGTPRTRPAPYAQPSATVLVPSDGLGQYLSSRLGGRNRHGLGFVEIANELIGTYQDLTICEATRRLIVEMPEWRIPAMNRELVERATHDDALDRLVAELDGESTGEWRSHAHRVTGDRQAKSTTAAHSVLRRSLPFMRQPVRQEEHVTTRLGGDRRMVDLPPGTTGAFGVEVTSLSVPGWMIRPSDRAAEAIVAPRLSDSGFIVEIGSTTLHYDIHGLQPTPSERRL
ncbi:MAG: CRISPR-associated helicase Cas3' [Gemmatimonas sp.]|jgi:CRISPR-associated endonuclease/helicase Cas3|uniref:CRISPR-associated helicase Cas3' n=1 Tax=Gemmatimonas sp. TaxID=1962908 RepID=UPI00391F6294